ncbi:MAG: hypothetical protein ACRC1P_09875 [Cellulosilyticaceae bacterium]
MRKLYYDVETEETLTEDELRSEYKTLAENGDTEAESFSDYLSNCLESEVLEYVGQIQ